MVVVFVVLSGFSFGGICVFNSVWYFGSEVGLRFFFGILLWMEGVEVFVWRVVVDESELGGRVVEFGFLFVSCFFFLFFLAFSLLMSLRIFSNVFRLSNVEGGSYCDVEY